MPEHIATKQTVNVPICDDPYGVNCDYCEILTGFHRGRCAYCKDRPVNMCTHAAVWRDLFSKEE